MLGEVRQFPARWWSSGLVAIADEVLAPLAIGRSVRDEQLCSGLYVVRCDVHDDINGVSPRANFHAHKLQVKVGQTILVGLIDKAQHVTLGVSHDPVKAIVTCPHRVALKFGGHGCIDVTDHHPRIDANNGFLWDELPSPQPIAFARTGPAPQARQGTVAGVDWSWWGTEGSQRALCSLLGGALAHCLAWHRFVGVTEGRLPMGTPNVAALAVAPMQASCKSKTQASFSSKTTSHTIQIRIELKVTAVYNGIRHARSKSAFRLRDFDLCSSAFFA